MSIEYIVEAYKVPAKVCGRVRYTGYGVPQCGVITGTRNAHILVLMDGSTEDRPYHPTWQMEYLPEDQKP